MYLLNDSADRWLSKERVSLLTFGIHRLLHCWLLILAVFLASCLVEPLAALQETVPANGDGHLLACTKDLGAAMLVGNRAETGSDSSRARLLGVNLDRIKRQMAALAPHGQRLLLRRTEIVNVYAPSLRVEILGDFNVESWGSSLGGRTGGAIAYGSPTHNEMMRAMVPAFWQQQANSAGGFSFGW